MYLTPEDIVGDTLLDYETIASLSPTHDTWPWQFIQLYIHSPADLLLVQCFFLLKSFPELECLPLITARKTERLMFIPRHPLPTLVELGCCTELDCHFNQMGDRRALLQREDYLFPLLYAASDARSLRFLNAFLVLYPVGAIQGPFILFPNVHEVSVEEEWQYISLALAHIALPPTAQFSVFAHTNNGHARPPAPRRLYLVEEETSDGIPYTNGAILTGAHDPSGLYDGVCHRNELTDGTWSVTVTNCLEFCSEAPIPVSLREIPAILLEVGRGLRAIQMVLYAMEDDEGLVPPNLSHLVLCHAALPSQYPLDPKDVLDMMREREKGWNKPLPNLTLRLPDQPRGCLAGCTTFIPDTLELMMQVLLPLSLGHHPLAGLDGSAPTVEIVRKYCQCCHDDDPGSSPLGSEGEWEETLARYRKMRQSQLA
ncbi:hypothetical protein LXA43DRAFT_1107960 [Ganoderma leucocontextum]|nr:hypothetical protein LXA43DRAFT_1107960 [Ganoderma leucocontextum]